MAEIGSREMCLAVARIMVTSLWQTAKALGVEEDLAEVALAYDLAGQAAVQGIAGELNCHFYAEGDDD